MERKGILHEAMNWIHLAEEKFQRLYLVQTAISLRVLQNVGNTLNSWTTISFSRYSVQWSWLWHVTSEQKLCKHVLTVNCKNKTYVQSFQMSLPLQFKLQYSDYTFNTPFFTTKYWRSQRNQQACWNIHERRFSVTVRQ